MVSSVSANAQINAAYPQPLQFKPELIALVEPKVGGGANSEGRFSSLAEMKALLTKCSTIKPVTYR